MTQKFALNVLRPEDNARSLRLEVALTMDGQKVQIGKTQAGRIAEQLVEMQAAIRSLYEAWHDLGVDPSKQPQFMPFHLLLVNAFHRTEMPGGFNQGDSR